MFDQLWWIFTGLTSETVQFAQIKKINRFHVQKTKNSTLFWDVILLSNIIVLRSNTNIALMYRIFSE